MRISCLIALAVIAATAAAEDRTQPRSRTGIDIVVPVDPRSHEDVYWFAGGTHHAVPGTVTIDRDPYVCDLDGARFGSSEALVAHVVGRHRVAADALAGRLVAVDGVLHFIPAR